MPIHFIACFVGWYFRWISSLYLTMSSHAMLCCSSWRSVTWCLWTLVLQYSTVQHSTVQCSAVQYSTVQYSTVQCSTVQYSTVQCSAVQYSTVLYIPCIEYTVHLLYGYCYLVPVAWGQSIVCRYPFILPCFMCMKNKSAHGVSWGAPAV